MNLSSIRSKIYLAFVLGSLAVLIAIFTMVRGQQLGLADKTVNDIVVSLAEQYFDSVNTLMLTGGMSHKNILRDKILNDPNIEEVRIIRGSKLNNIFGPGDVWQQAKDDREADALKGISASWITKIDGERHFHYLTPLKATPNTDGGNCMACHQATENEVLGAIKFRYSMRAIDSTIAANIRVSLAVVIAILVIVTVMVLFVVEKWIFRRVTFIGNNMRYASDTGDLRVKADAEEKDELGVLAYSFNTMLQHFADNMQHVADSSEILMDSVQQIAASSEQTEHEVAEQKNKTVDASTAMHTLKEQAQEVGRITQAATSMSTSSDELATASMHAASKTEDRINQLAENIRGSAVQVNNLHSQTLQVDSVMEVISTIAEQTNLLALNAAIEAARAGDAGRGFAVVATEVRNLANKTTESTKEIKQTIEKLQLSAKNTVAVIEDASEAAVEQAQDVQHVATKLRDISAQMSEINQLNRQIADATQQQNVAIEKVSTNLLAINEHAETSLTDSRDTKAIGDRLLQLANKLDQQVSRFQL